MICQDCGVEAPTKYVSFYQNIGCLVMRFSKSIDGYLCKSCIHKNFWTFTLINLTLGWWGVISLIVTPFMILNNVIRYIFCLGMEGVPVNAKPPQFNDDVIEKLNPHAEGLIQRINSGEDFDRVAADIAMRAGVTPGQVAMYVRALVAASQSQS